MAKMASPGGSATSLEQLRDTLVGDPQHPAGVAHSQVGTMNQVGGNLRAHDRRLTL
jgi:hypothetical protein